MGVNTLTSSYECIRLYHKDANPQLSSKAPTLFEIFIWAFSTTIQLDKYLPTMAKNEEVKGRDKGSGRR